MLQFIKNFFKSSPPKYEIVFYPNSGKYFVMRNGIFLHKRHNTGIIENTEFGLLFAEQFRAEKWALLFIKEAKEQMDGVNVVVKQVP